MSKSEKFANIIIGGISILCLLIFSYSLYRYTLHPPSHMIKYNILSLTGAVCFAIVLFKCTKELKINISILLISAVLSIYAVEIILPYNQLYKDMATVRINMAKEAGIPYDSRHRLSVWMDLREKGIEAYPLYSPYDNIKLNASDILPLGFISDKPVIFCNESGEFIIFKTDEHGFNNPDGLYFERSSDVLLIGDSFTQGACLNREENIAGRLMAKGVKVLNLGMLNSGPPKELAILKEYGRLVKPKTVFWLFYEGNDYEGLDFEKKSPIYMNYLDKNFSRHLVNKQEVIDKMLLQHLEKEFGNLIEGEIKLQEDKTNKQQVSLTSSFLSVLKLTKLRKRGGFFNQECEFQFDPLMKAIFIEATRTVREWDGQLVFVYLPSYYRYSERNNSCKVRFLDKGKKELISVIEELQLPIIDIQDAFDAHPDPLSFFPFRIYGHYNADGYKLVADYLGEYLSDNHKQQK